MHRLSFRVYPTNPSPRSPDFLHPTTPSLRSPDIVHPTTPSPRSPQTSRLSLSGRANRSASGDKAGDVQPPLPSATATSPPSQVPTPRLHEGRQDEAEWEAVSSIMHGTSACYSRGGFAGIMFLIMPWARQKKEKKDMVCSRLQLLSVCEGKTENLRPQTLLAFNAVARQQYFTSNITFFYFWRADTTGKNKVYWERIESL